MRFHVLGVGPVGTLVAHHLRHTLSDAHSVVLIHKALAQMRFAQRMDNTLVMERDGVKQLSGGYRSEVFIHRRQLKQDKLADRLRKRMEWKKKAGITEEDRVLKSWVAQADSPENLAPSAEIESLFVTTKAYNVVSAIQELVPRLNINSTIVLMNNGMGVYEKLLETVFQNPASRPHFIVTVNDNGAFLRRYMHVIHSGLGSIRFGIVADPDGRDYEASLYDTDLPRDARKLSLDSIVDPNGESTARYLSLRNTVAALSGLEGLGAVWEPMSDVLIAMKRKVVVNAVINPLTALMGCRNGDIFETEGAKRIMERVCLEASWAFAAEFCTQEEEATPNNGATLKQRARAIALGQNVVTNFPPTLTAEALQAECIRVAKATAGNVSSMLGDVQKGKGTEIIYMNGYLLQIGTALRIPMNTTATLLNLVKMRTTIPIDQMLK